MPRYVELAIGNLRQSQRGQSGTNILKKVTHVAVHPVNCADMSADGSNKFLDAKVLARLMGQPLLSRFPMEGTVSGQHKSFHRGLLPSRTTLFQQRRALLRRQWLMFAQDDCSLVKLHLQNISRFQLSTVANFVRKDDFAIGRQGRVHGKIKALPARPVK